MIADVKELISFANMLYYSLSPFLVLIVIEAGPRLLNRRNGPFGLLLILKDCNRLVLT